MGSLVNVFEGQAFVENSTENINICHTILMGAHSLFKVIPDIMAQVLGYITLLHHKLPGTQCDLLPESKTNFTKHDSC